MSHLLLSTCPAAKVLKRTLDFYWWYIIWLGLKNSNSVCIDCFYRPQQLRLKHLNFRLCKQGMTGVMASLGEHFDISTGFDVNRDKQVFQHGLLNWFIFPHRPYLHYLYFPVFRKALRIWGRSMGVFKWRGKRLFMMVLHSRVNSLHPILTEIVNLKHKIKV